MTSKERFARLRGFIDAAERSVDSGAPLAESREHFENAMLQLADLKARERLGISHAPEAVAAKVGMAKA